GWSNDFRFQINSDATAKMTLNSTGLNVVGTVTTTSDKRFKFNEKPLVNALDYINKLEPVEYDQTFDLVDNYTQETPQSHQCGFIAQSVQSIDELKHAVVGGQVGDDGKESIRALNYNAIFTYAVKAIQELSQIVKAQQVQINELQAQIRTTC
ncbi:MAG: tail fiber domain-containing protein, partial [Candidatus Fonsibacter sp.]